MESITDNTKSNEKVKSRVMPVYHEETNIEDSDFEAEYESPFYEEEKTRRKSSNHGDLKMYGKADIQARPFAGDTLQDKKLDIILEKMNQFEKVVTKVQRDVNDYTNNLNTYYEQTESKLERIMRGRDISLETPVKRRDNRPRNKDQGLTEYLRKQSVQKN